MTTVNDIRKMLDMLAPEKTKLDFDNVGLLVGDPDRQVSKILVSLDITGEVAEEAKEMRAQLIISHHPVFFSLKSVISTEPEGRIVMSLIKNGISAVCMHTNLDMASGGVNDMLAEKLGVINTRILNITGNDESGAPYGIGRAGEIQSEMRFLSFAEFVKKSLNCRGIRYYDSGRPVKNVAVGGGACGEYLRKAFYMGCDTYVTAEVKHNVFLDAKELGINLIDAGHYCTEDVVCVPLVKTIKDAFPEIEVIKSAVHTETSLYM